MTGRSALALVMLPGLILIGCSSKSAPETLWIGHLAQLSGPGQARGQEARLGIKLAVDEETAAGLKALGRPLAVRHVDTRGDAESARAEAIRLITVDKVAALLVETDAATAERVGRESLAYGVPVLVLGELASPPGENVFVLGAGPAARGRALAQFVASEFQTGKVAVLVDGRNALAGALAASFVKECRKNGHAPALELEYLNEEELKERVSSLIKSRPAVVFVAGSLSDTLRVRADLRAAELRVPMLFGGEDEGATVLATTGDAGSDVYLATAFAVEKLSENGRNFARRFQEEAGASPTLAAALAYDGTRLIFEALSQANSTLGTKIREQLGKVEAFETVTGKMSFKERQAQRPVFVVRLRGREAEVVKTVVPVE